MKNKAQHQNQEKTTIQQKKPTKPKNVGKPKLAGKGGPREHKEPHQVQQRDKELVTTSFLK